MFAANGKKVLLPTRLILVLNVRAYAGVEMICLHLEWRVQLVSTSPACYIIVKQVAFIGEKPQWSEYT